MACGGCGQKQSSQQDSFYRPVVNVISMAERFDRRLIFPIVNRLSNPDYLFVDAVNGWIDNIPFPFSGNPAPRGCAASKIMVLDTILRHPQRNDVLFAEDDCEFHTDWVRILNNAIKELKELGINEYILFLGALTLEVPNWFKNQYYQKTLGMWVEQQANPNTHTAIYIKGRKRIEWFRNAMASQWLKQNGSGEMWGNDDYFVADKADADGIPLFAIRPISASQHIGVSTINQKVVNRFLWLRRIRFNMLERSPVKIVTGECQNPSKAKAIQRDWQSEQAGDRSEFVLIEGDVVANISTSRTIPAIVRMYDTCPQSPDDVLLFDGKRVQVNQTIALSGNHVFENRCEGMKNKIYGLELRNV